jgi:deltex-like protein
VRFGCIRYYNDMNTSILKKRYNDVLGKCAVCAKAYIVEIGNQPANGVMSVHTYPPDQGIECDGYESEGTIVIQYSFRSGIQGSDHPNPGVMYSGTSRAAFLPDIPEGREVAALLRICFERRLTFTVGRSLTTGRDNCIVWNGVHHKTNPSGGTQYYGWPDSSYFFRVKEELKAKGIVTVT